ncbi:MAG: hypothetical protein LBS44_05555 [Deltaproteobacteria bacterium]|jgi:hypothetical protein|nr:hypothetical protein [Deltaproteobacteria bacterium]
MHKRHAHIIIITVVMTLIMVIAEARADLPLLPTGLKPYPEGADRETVLQVFMSLPYREDGVVTDDGRWATWNAPDHTLTGPGFNCSGYLLEVIRHLSHRNISLNEANFDRGGDSGPDSEYGLDWDYGLDIILNLSGANFSQLIPPSPDNTHQINSKGRPEGLGLDINGPDFPAMMQSLEPDNIYLFAISKPDRRFKGGLSYYHVGMLHTDKAGNIWVYQSTKRTGVHRLNLNNPGGIATIRRYFPPIKNAQRRIVLARFNPNNLSGPKNYSVPNNVEANGSKINSEVQPPLSETVSKVGPNKDNSPNAKTQFNNTIITQAFNQVVQAISNKSKEAAQPSSAETISTKTAKLKSDQPATALPVSEKSLRQNSVDNKTVSESTANAKTVTDSAASAKTVTESTANAKTVTDSAASVKAATESVASAKAVTESVASAKAATDSTTVSTASLQTSRDKSAPEAISKEATRADSSATSVKNKSELAEKIVVSNIKVKDTEITVSKIDNAKDSAEKTTDQAVALAKTEKEKAKESKVSKVEAAAPKSVAANKDTEKSTKSRGEPDNTIEVSEAAAKAINEVRDKENQDSKNLENLEVESADGSLWQDIAPVDSTELAAVDPWTAAAQMGAEASPLIVDGDGLGGQVVIAFNFVPDEIIAQDQAIDHSLAPTEARTTEPTEARTAVPTEAQTVEPTIAQTKYQFIGELSQAKNEFKTEVLPLPESEGAPPVADRRRGSLTVSSASDEILLINGETSVASAGSGTPKALGLQKSRSSVQTKGSAKKKVKLINSMTYPVETSAVKSTSVEKASYSSEEEFENGIKIFTLVK